MLRLSDTSSEPHYRITLNAAFLLRRAGSHDTALPVPTCREDTDMTTGHRRSRAGTFGVERAPADTTQERLREIKQRHLLLILSPFMEFADLLVGLMKGKRHLTQMRR